MDKGSATVINREKNSFFFKIGRIKVQKEEKKRVENNWMMQPK